MNFLSFFFVNLDELNLNSLFIDSIYFEAPSHFLFLLNMKLPTDSKNSTSPHSRTVMEYRRIVWTISMFVLVVCMLLGRSLAETPQTWLQCYHKCYDNCLFGTFGSYRATENCDTTCNTVCELTVHGKKFCILFWCW